MLVDSNSIKRYWINQPSTLHKFNKLHGVKVIGVKEGKAVRIFFIEGNTVSMRVPSNILSEY